MQSTQRYDYWGGDSERNSVVEEEALFPLKTLWKAEGIYAPDADIFLTESAVVVMSSTHAIRKRKSGEPRALRKVSFFDRNTGKLNWEHSLVESLGEGGGTICCYKDMVVVSEKSSKSVVALRNNQVLWRLKDIFLVRSMQHVDDEIVFGAQDGIYFVSPITGEVLKKIEVERASSITISGELIVAFNGETHFYNCYNRNSGDLVWSTDFGKLGEWKSPLGVELGSLGARCAPVVNNMVYTAANGDRIVCVDLINGELKWMTSLPLMYEVLYRNGFLFGTASRDFYRLDPSTGEVLHKSTFLQEFHGKNLPYMAGKYLFCTGLRLVALDSETGEVVWSYFDKKKASGFTGQPVYLEGRLYAADTKGSVYCFGS